MLGRQVGDLHAELLERRRVILTLNNALLGQLVMADDFSQLGTKQQPDFDSRSYGYGKLSDLMAATALFDLERRAPGEGKPAVLFVRDRRYPAPDPPG
jgi:hypothetical protein